MATKTRNSRRYLVPALVIILAALVGIPLRGAHALVVLIPLGLLAVWALAAAGRAQAGEWR